MRAFARAWRLVKARYHDPARTIGAVDDMLALLVGVVAQAPLPWAAEAQVRSGRRGGSASGNAAQIFGSVTPVCPWYFPFLSR